MPRSSPVTVLMPLPSVYLILFQLLILHRPEPTLSIGCFSEYQWSWVDPNHKSPLVPDGDSTYLFSVAQFQLKLNSFYRRQTARPPLLEALFLVKLPAGFQDRMATECPQPLALAYLLAAQVALQAIPDMTRYFIYSEAAMRVAQPRQLGLNGDVHHDVLVRSGAWPFQEAMHHTETLLRAAESRTQNLISNLTSPPEHLPENFMSNLDSIQSPNPLSLLVRVCGVEKTETDALQDQLRQWLPRNSKLIMCVCSEDEAARLGLSEWQEQLTDSDDKSSSSLELLLVSSSKSGHLLALEYIANAYMTGTLPEIFVVVDLAESNSFSLGALVQVLRLLKSNRVDLEAEFYSLAKHYAIRRRVVSAQLPEVLSNQDSSSTPVWVLGGPCCGAHFMVSRDMIERHGLLFYMHLKDWLHRQETIGVTHLSMDLLWPLVFQKDPDRQNSDIQALKLKYGDESLRTAWTDLLLSPAVPARAIGDIDTPKY